MANAESVATSLSEFLEGTATLGAESQKAGDVARPPLPHPSTRGLPKLGSILARPVALI